MLVDTSRNLDIAELLKLSQDETKPEAQRRRAARTIEKIKLKMNDPFIRATRERLIKATKANDHTETWKISEQLHEYEYYKYRG